MPFAKDIRVGQGWFEVNVNCFFDYLDGMDEELIVKNDFCASEVAYHNKNLEEEIESKVNEYISWRVFGEERNKLDEEDFLPKEFEDDIWGYVYSQIWRLVRRKPTCYELRSTREEVDEAQNKYPPLPASPAESDDDTDEESDREKLTPPVPKNPVVKNNMEQAKNKKVIIATYKVHYVFKMPKLDFDLDDKSVVDYYDLLHDELWIRFTDKNRETMKVELTQLIEDGQATYDNTDDVVVSDASDWGFDDDDISSDEEDEDKSDEED